MNFVSLLFVFCSEVWFTLGSSDSSAGAASVGSQDPFIELIDVSQSALGGEQHGGSFLTAPGIAVFDCDGDGFEDILYASQENEYHKFFINNGDFTFREEAVQRGINTTYGSYGVVAFDFDNNGDIDLAFSYVGTFLEKSIQFYYNVGNCQFEDRTESILDGIPELWIGGGLSAGDYDRDGDLDLIVNSRGSHPVPRIPPHQVSGFSMIYENTLDPTTGDFTFKVQPRSTPPIPDYLTFVCVSGWEDFDEDGYEDVVIGICGDPYGIGAATHLWRNNFPQSGIADFEDVTADYGLGKCNDIDVLRGPQFPMSISYGHLDDDNHFDLFTTNAGTPALYTMYRANWRGKEFLGYEIVDVEGFVYDQFSWGATFIDLDNDAKDDIVTVGSFVAEFGPDNLNPGYVYQNKVTPSKYVFEETQTLGLEWSSSVVANGDFDNDGFRDIAVNTVCDAFPLDSDCDSPVPLKLYRNNGADIHPDRYYLDVALRGNGVGTNYYGVGSMIHVKVIRFQYYRTGKIRIGADGGNTNSAYAHFGIVNRHRMLQNADRNNVKAIVCVEWMGADNTKECFFGVDLNQRITLTQGKGRAFH